MPTGQRRSVSNGPAVVPYDPAQAKKLLAAAGASNLTFTLHTYSESLSLPNVLQLTQAMVGYWKQIGVDVTLDVVDTAAYTQKVLAHTFDGAYMLGSLGYYSDASNLTSGYTSTGAYSSVKNATLDNLFGQLGAAINDPTAHDAIVKQISDNIYDNVCALPIVSLDTVAAFGPRIAQYERQAGDGYPGPFYGISVK